MMLKWHLDHSAPFTSTGSSNGSRRLDVVVAIEVIVDKIDVFTGAEGTSEEREGSSESDGTLLGAC